MKLVTDSSTRRGVAVLAMAVALAGCTGAAATPVVIYATSTPAVTSTATPAPTQTATPTIAPTATPAATSTPAPTATPAPTQAPAASPTSAAAACTATADLKAFFVEAATNLHFDVYCAVLPSSWWLQSASYVLPAGGYLEAEYKNSGGADFQIREGGWCPPDKACIAPGASIGSASFAGLAGTLYLNITTYTLRVGTYANPAYFMVGSGMSKEQFVAWAAALVKVPKP
jgi:hypothetical protein